MVHLFFEKKIQSRQQALIGFNITYWQLWRGFICGPTCIGFQKGTYITSYCGCSICTSVWYRLC